MMRNAFPRIEADLAFYQAFPDSLGRSQSVARAMIKAADTLGFRGLAARIRTDAAFTRILTAIVRPVSCIYGITDVRSRSPISVSARSGVLSRNARMPMSPPFTKLCRTAAPRRSTGYSIISHTSTLTM